MIYSRSCEYAIRALVYLARREANTYCTIKEIHCQEGVPKSFAGKLLQILGRCGVLCSQRGPGGGFMLARPADEIHLIEIVEAIDGHRQLDRCTAGIGICHEREMCPMQDRWCVLREEMIQLLRSETIGDLARKLPRLSRRNDAEEVSNN